MTNAKEFLVRVVARAACALLLVVVAGSDGAVSSRSERVEFVLLALETPEGRDGVLGPTFTAATATAVLETGSTGTFFLAIDKLRVDGTDQASRCATSIGSVPPGGDPDQRRNIESAYARVWWVRLRPMSADFGDVAVEVEWERRESSGRGDAKVVAGDRAIVNMREGDRNLFDFIEYQDEAAPACRRNTMVGFSASIAEDPALADAVLTYDLWVRHSRPRGDDVVRRFRGTGRQGEAVQFSFAPLRFPVPGVTLADGSRVEVVLEIVGSLRGRVRPDGSIDVDLDATRWSNLVRAGTDSRGGTAGTGRKTVTVVPGETVALGLPVPRGAAGASLTVSRSETSSGKLSDPSPGEIVVNYEDFFAGHLDDLIVTVTRD